MLLLIIICCIGKSHNILACQSHPEFNLQYAMLDRIWPVVVEKRQRVIGEDVEIAKQTFAEYTGEDAKLFLRDMSDFLHYQSEQQQSVVVD